MGAGKGWSNEENVLACKSYLAHSSDPDKGSGKKPDVFHKEVEETYVRLRDELIAVEPDLRHSLNMRSGRAIAQRYKKRIRAECLAIESCVARIKGQKPTGNPSEEDILRFAVAMHDGAPMSKMYDYLRNPERVSRKPCHWLNCLRYLRSTAAWEKTRAAVVRAALDGKAPEADGQESAGENDNGEADGNGAATANSVPPSTSAAGSASRTAGQGPPTAVAGPAPLPKTDQSSAVPSTGATDVPGIPQDSPSADVARTAPMGVDTVHGTNGESGHRANGLPSASPAPGSVAPFSTALANATEEVVGTKRAFELGEHTAALHRGATAVEEVTKELAKRNKISYEFLAMERQKNRIQLFSMPGTSTEMRDRFLQLSQETELRDMERSLRPDSRPQYRAVRIAPSSQPRAP